MLSGRKGHEQCRGRRPDEDDPQAVRAARRHAKGTANEGSGGHRRTSRPMRWTRSPSAVAEMQSTRGCCSPDGSPWPKPIDWSRAGSADLPTELQGTMSSPFNMPDEYVQGFFKAGQSLLQALTPLHSDAQRDRSACTRLAVGRTADELLPAAAGAVGTHADRRCGQRNRWWRPSAATGASTPRSGATTLVQPAQADLPAQFAAARPTWSRRPTWTTKDEAQAALLHAPVRRRDEPGQLCRHQPGRARSSRSNPRAKACKAGFANLLEDLRQGRISITDETAFEVGTNVAVSEGAVIFENELFQLIQYAPLTEQVATRPLVIVPPCINKFYILDLQPENSFVRFACEQGHDGVPGVVAQSRRELGHITWDDYVEQGAMKAIEVALADQRRRQGQCGGLVRGRHHPLVGAGRDARARRRVGGQPDAADHDARLPRSGRPGRVHRRARRVAARADDRPGRHLPGRRTRLRVPDPARQRPDLAQRDQQLPQGQVARGLRPAVLERRRHQPARADVRLVPAQHVPREQPARAEPADDVRHAGRPRPTSTCRAMCWPRRKTTSCPGARPTARRSWSAASRSSCSAPAATSPASSTRRRRTSAATGPAASRATTRKRGSPSATETPGSWWTHWIKWLKPQAGKAVAARTQARQQRSTRSSPRPGAT